jgi:hypothetical protein
LEQESQIFSRRLEREKKSARLQNAFGWTILLMLPSIAITCIVIFFDHRNLPPAIVSAASAAFFVDVTGSVIAAYKTLLPTAVQVEQLLPITADPFQE